MKTQDLFSKNKLTVHKLLQENSTYFSQNKNSQAPKYAWIGCSDSRVSPELLLEAKSGEVLVHRSIGNTIMEHDKLIPGFLYLATQLLGIKHIFVCGHSDCNVLGLCIKNEGNDFPFINAVKHEIDQLKEKFKSQLDLLESFEEKSNFLIAQNVIHQVRKLQSLDFLKNTPEVLITGLVCNVGDGLLNKVC